MSGHYATITPEMLRGGPRTLYGHPIKPDELRLLETLWQREQRAYKVLPIRSAIAETGMHEKRAYSILLKWTGRGWTNYGVSPFGSWWEPEGVAMIARVLEPTPNPQAD